MGPYKLMEQIGEGGMGLVFVAEQTQPIRRRVALKILKPGMDSREVIARFEAERQALALMDHPNIARVFDGGATDSGRPYFVMELVKGPPITQFCDEQHLTPRERLELFVDVVGDVQHAHQKGVIHRDLKPSNVLVASHDGKPVVKVIDFGIAKAVGQQLTDKTVYTGFAQLIGTPLYMSPEQAGLSSLDIDTRTDVYALGVLVYELLTGTTPFDAERLRRAGYDEMRRIIREEEPPRPSTRLSTLGQAAATVSAQRRSDPKRLSKLCRGELDWIVMKALEKDRDRRYETASAFAADVRRYLADEPVQACPPSAWYRCRKFARRNKTALTMAALILFYIALLGAGAGWLIRDEAAREEEAARDRADRQTQAARELEQALDRAELCLGQGRRAEALAACARAELLAGQSAPDASLGRRLAALKGDQQFLTRFDDIRLRTQSGVDFKKGFTLPAAFPEFREALHGYGIELGHTPPAEVAARLQGRPEAVYRNLVVALDECLIYAPRAEAATRRWLLAAVQAADNDDWRARVRRALLDRNWEVLEPLIRGVDVRQQPPGFLLVVARTFPAHKRSPQLDLLRRLQRAYQADLWANMDLAGVLDQEGHSAEAVRYYTAALALRPDNAGILVNRARALERAGETDAAIADYAQAIFLAPAYPTAHFDLGVMLHRQGKLDEAVKCYNKAIALDHNFANPYINLGNALAEKGDFKEAIRCYRRAIGLTPDSALAHNNLGRALLRQGESEAAIAELREAIRLKEDFADAHYNLGNALYGRRPMDEVIAAYRRAIHFKPDYPEAHNNLGTALKAKGQLDGAIAAYSEAICLKPDYAEAHYNLGNALRDNGQRDEAILCYREAIRCKQDSPKAHTNLGNALRDKGLVDEAIAEFRAALATRQDFPEAYLAHAFLGSALAVKGRFDEAAGAFREAIRLKGDDAENYCGLGNAYGMLGRLDEAIRAFQEAIRLKQDYAEAHCNLGNALRLKGRLDEALREIKEAIRLRKDVAYPHNNLGLVLAAKGQLDDAVAAYREAIRIDKNLADAHCNLGGVLRRQGKFREALAAYRRGHELGSRDPRWRSLHPASAQSVRQCQRLVELDEKVPDFLAGKATPAGPAECLELADLCARKHWNRAAARFYGEAFAAQPRLADDLGAGHRYDAACSAAQAGCGQGQDADRPDHDGRARLRRLALDWLRADLNAWRRRLDQESDMVRPKLVQQMRHWQGDPALAGVREPEALARLPEVEQRAWREFWAGVASTLAQGLARAL
jgi:tetratricopeptide (TPR) repeat protein